MSDYCFKLHKDNNCVVVWQGMGLYYPAENGYWFRVSNTPTQDLVTARNIPTVWLCSGDVCEPPDYMKPHLGNIVKGC